MPTLPVETYEHIIDQLAILPPVWPDTPFFGLSKQRVALSACCLVCKDWLPRARLLLYRVAVVDIHSISSFAYSLAANSSNGHITTHLMVTGESTSDSKTHSLSLLPLLLPRRLPSVTHMGFIRVNFTKHHPSFYNSMRLFNGVEGISWCACTFSSPLHTIRLLRAFPSLKTAQSVANIKLPFPMSLSGMLWAKHQRTLRLSKVSLTASGKSEQDPSDFSPMILLCCPAAIQDLSLFCNRFCDGDFGGFNFLYSCRDTLRFLTLDVACLYALSSMLMDTGYGSSRILHSFAFPCSSTSSDPSFWQWKFSRLEELKIHHSLEETERQSLSGSLLPASYFYDACRFLARLETPALKCMEIIVLTWKPNWPNSSFDPIETVFCQERYKSYELIIRVYGCYAEDSSQSKFPVPPSIVRDVFPALASRQNVKFPY